MYYIVANSARFFFQIQILEKVITYMSDEATKHTLIAFIRYDLRKNWYSQ